METDRARFACGAVGRGANIAMIRVILPPNLRTLAHVESELGLELNGTLTQRSLLDAVEAKYPMLGGTIPDHRCNCGWVDNPVSLQGPVLFDAPRRSHRLIAWLTRNRYAPAHV